MEKIKIKIERFIFLFSYFLQNLKYKISDKIRIQRETKENKRKKRSTS